MKTLAPAAILADAIGLAASLAGGSERVPAFAAVRLTGGNSLTIAAGNGDASLSITIEADAEGEAAVPAKRLAELLKHFDGDAVTITATENTATVTSRKSRYRLPIMPLADTPSPLALEAETGRVELDRTAAQDLFKRPAFAIPAEKSRFYLNGIFLHDVDGGLAAVATDGRRLARVIVPATTSLSSDRSLVVPATAVKTIDRLLAGATGTVVLRRSERLLELTAGSTRLTSKLIDATFPDYERLITDGAESAVTLDRKALATAIARFEAIADPHGTKPGVALTWADGELHLRAADGSEDSLAAEVCGIGETGVQAGLLAEQVAALRGQSVRLAATEPIIVTDPDDPNLLTLLSSMRIPKARGDQP